MENHSKNETTRKSLFSFNAILTHFTNTTKILHKLHVKREIIDNKCTKQECYSWNKLAEQLKSIAVVLFNLRFNTSIQWQRRWFVWSLMVTNNCLIWIRNDNLWSSLSTEFKWSMSNENQLQKSIQQMGAKYTAGNAGE